MLSASLLSSLDSLSMDTLARPGPLSHATLNEPASLTNVATGSTGRTLQPGNKTPRNARRIGGEEVAQTENNKLAKQGLNSESRQTFTTALEGRRIRRKYHETSTNLSPFGLLGAVRVAHAVPIPIKTCDGSSENAGLPQLSIDERAQDGSQVAEVRRLKVTRRPRHRTQASHSPKQKSQSPPEVSIDHDLERHAESRSAAQCIKHGNGIHPPLLALHNASAVTLDACTPTSRRSLDLRPHAFVLDDIPLGSLQAAESGLTKMRQPSWQSAGPFSRAPTPPLETDAGVFGALIASTGNLIGPAAPALSSLAPSLKRPGYNLSRYSLQSDVPQVPSVNETPLPRRPASVHLDTAQHVAPSGGASLDHSGTASFMPTRSDVTLPRPRPNIETARRRWSGALKALPKRGWRRTSTATLPGTPTTDNDEWLSEKESVTPEGNHEMPEKKRKDRWRRRKNEEVYITRHVAEILQRQEFICKLARSIMMFGGPSHRLQAQIQATARVLDVELSCMYLPDLMLISFEDKDLGTSNVKLVRQGGVFDIAKLQDTHELYWKVIHDQISVQEASSELDALMRKPPLYNNWQLIFFGGMCSASICSVSFNGSFIDSLVSFPLGCALIVIQLFANKHELYSNVFEITVATLFSFLSAALASSKLFCYSAVASSSVVLILPGYIILCGSLELSSHNLVSGAVRVCFSVIYSLFLGFGLAIGASAFSKISNHPIREQNDLTCSVSHPPNAPWYQQTPSLAWAFLTVPMYSLWLSLRFHAPWNKRELVLLVLVSCIGWVCNHFTGTKFPGQSDVSAAVGALAVGFVANLYARVSEGNAFVIMITGILFQVPSGVANGGLFTFVSKQDMGQSSAEVYLSGFQTALQLVSVAIGLTVGLGISLVLVFPIQSRRRAGGIFSL